MRTLFDEKIYEFFTEVGYSEAKISKLNNSTRLFHDLNEYGDNADDIVNTLIKFDVDMTGFEISDYFPEEFLGNNFLTRELLSFLPRHIFLRNRHFHAFTIEMIGKLLASKSWKETVF